MKKLIYIFLALFLFSCEKEVDSSNSENSSFEDDCNCGIVISVYFDPEVTDGYLQSRYDTKVRNECSNNIKKFTLIPDNGDKIPEEGGYLCRSNSW